MNKPHMMDEKWWWMHIEFNWWEIDLVEEWETLWHYIWGITEECVRAMLHYWRFKAMEMNKDYVQFSHPCSERLIEVRKKNIPRYKRLFNSFKK